MKALLKQMAHADNVNVEGALKVIDRFDQLMVGGASLDRLLVAAANASGRDAGNRGHAEPPNQQSLNPCQLR